MVVHPFFYTRFFLSKFALAFHEFCDAIIWGGLVGNRLSALFACMHDQPALFAVVIHVIRRHEALAHGSAVSRALSIYVFRVKTFRAVIAVTAMGEGINGHAAVFARKRFLSGDKGCHV